MQTSNFTEEEMRRKTEKWSHSHKAQWGLELSCQTLLFSSVLSHLEKLLSLRKVQETRGLVAKRIGGLHHAWAGKSLTVLSLFCTITVM